MDRCLILPVTLQNACNTYPFCKRFCYDKSSITCVELEVPHLMQKIIQKLSLAGIMAAMFVLSPAGFAGEPLPNPVSNPAFERIKQLAGNWQGTTIAPNTGKEETVSVRYEVTSGGTTVIERVFVGTPYEMMTAYYPEGQGVGVTHYCMLGNRPALSLNKADDTSLAFEMKGTQGIASLGEQHMHGLILTFEGKDTLKQEWECFKDSKPNEHVTIKLTRQ